MHMVMTESQQSQPGDHEADSCETFLTNPQLVSRLKRELSGAAAPIADFFRALGDESRCTMLLALSKSEELCVCDLSEITGLAMPTVSHHLRKLKERRLVEARREGKVMFYRLVDDDVRLLLRLTTSRRGSPLAVLGAGTSP